MKQTKQTSAGDKFLVSDVRHSESGSGTAVKETGSRTIADALLTEYTNMYMGKVFYFCLRKTGNVVEAEDLASDVALNILAALRSGTVPQNFAAWVWQIARNRYRLWAIRKRRTLDALCDGDIAEMELAAQDDDFENLVQSFTDDESISLLRRELAFLSADYRKIVVGFYIEDRSVRDLAAAFMLPEGTVKSKLFRARKMIREGMEMAREFGKMSYKPENVRFSMNGSDGNDGEPWSLYRRALPKNILLAAYRSPSTAEELAVELGVALPYLEEELDILTEGTLLRKSADKYETNFVIVSAEAQETASRTMKDISAEVFADLVALLKTEEKLYDDAGARWHEGFQSEEDLKIARVLRTMDSVVLESFPDDLDEHPQRPNDGSWDLVGYEECHPSDKVVFIGNHCTNPEDGRSDLFRYFSQFKIMKDGMHDKTPEHLTNEACNAIVCAAEGRGQEIPDYIVKYLCKYGYLRKSGSEIVPNIWIQRRSEKEKVHPIRKTPEWKKLSDKMGAYVRLCEETVCAEVSTFLREDKHAISQAVDMLIMGYVRDAVFKEALRSGYATFDASHWQGIGAYMII